MLEEAEAVGEPIAGKRAVAEVEAALAEIARIEALPIPPTVPRMPACRRCAYAPLCWG